MEKAKVYFTKNVSSEGLMQIYKVLGRELKGRIAVKISTGEPGGHHYLAPSLIKALVKELNGTIVECNTAYAGRRNTTEAHYEAIKEHGFMDIAPCDIMDATDDMEIHFEGGNHLKGVNYVGTHMQNYDSMLILSHFKGHAMGGFGGALKNMSIGVASSRGKAWIHSVGITNDPNEMWAHTDDQDGFLESMAEADKSIIDYFGSNNLAYINVLNYLSIDCDCDSNPHAPEMGDIGIFASLDPVALDQCSYDAIVNAEDKGKTSLVNRMEEKHAIHILEEGERLGLGTREYEVISIDE